MEVETTMSEEPINTPILSDEEYLQIQELLSFISGASMFHNFEGFISRIERTHIAGPVKLGPKYFKVERVLRRLERAAHAMIEYREKVRHDVEQTVLEAEAKHVAKARDATVRASDFVSRIDKKIH
jgi:hypothetical protein